MTLCYEHHHQFNRCWNPVGDLSYEPILGLIESQLGQADFEIGSDLAKRIEWLVRNAVREVYFSDLVRPSKAPAWIGWLERGHLPYGWWGDFHDGKLVVA